MHELIANHPDIIKLLFCKMDFEKRLTGSFSLKLHSMQEVKKFHLEKKNRLNGKKDNKIKWETIKKEKINQMHSTIKYFNQY